MRTVARVGSPALARACSWNSEYVVRFLQLIELPDAAKIAQKERVDGPTLISLVSPTRPAPPRPGCQS